MRRELRFESWYVLSFVSWLDLPTEISLDVCRNALRSQRHIRHMPNRRSDKQPEFTEFAEFCLAA
jgi:hypothetical protein